MIQTYRPASNLNNHTALKRRITSSIAAFILSLLFMGSFSCQPAAQRPSAARTDNTIIVPERLKVELEQANGHVLSFSGNGNGFDTTRTPVGISSMLRPFGAGEDTAVNILRTPRGESYAITLEDGTSIYLDAGTCLKFPSKFPGNIREIFLAEGQIYCRVAADQRPFVVRTSNGRAETRSYAFNIKSLGGQTTVGSKTAMSTVIDGKGRAIRVLPGQQVVSQPNGKPFKRDPVPPEQIGAWMQGCYPFTNTTLAAVCEEIHRVYNVPVTIDSLCIKDKRLSGSLDKKLTLKTVSDNLCAIGGLRWYVDKADTLHFSGRSN